MSSGSLIAKDPGWAEELVDGAGVTVVGASVAALVGDLGFAGDVVVPRAVTGVVGAVYTPMIGDGESVRGTP